MPGKEVGALRGCVWCADLLVRYGDCGGGLKSNFSLYSESSFRDSGGFSFGFHVLFVVGFGAVRDTLYMLCCGIYGGCRNLMVFSTEYQ